MQQYDYSESCWYIVGTGLAPSATYGNCKPRIIRIFNNRLPLFYGAVYITLRLVLAERAIYADASHPVCPYDIPWRKCKPQITHRPKRSLHRILLSSLARRFIANGRSSDTFPTKSDANLTFDRDLVEVERSDLGLDESAHFTTESLTMSCGISRIIVLN